MILRGTHRYFSFAAALSIAGCSQPETSDGSTTATINLAKASEIKAIECEAAFAAGPDEISKGDEGSRWTWLKGKDGTLSNYCQKQPSGVVTAWDEASRNQAATHSLIFESHKMTVRFLPISR